MTHVLLKVYAAFHPVDAACCRAVELAGAGALGQEEPWLILEGDLVRISFEGIWFPVEDVCAALETCLARHARGKLDVLDLEAWTLTRFVWEQGSLARSERDLNHVLAYSGH